MKSKPNWKPYRSHSQAVLSGCRLAGMSSNVVVFGEDVPIQAGKVYVCFDREASKVGVQNADDGPLTVFNMRRSLARRLCVKGILNALRKGYVRGPLPWSVEDGMVIVDCSGLPDLENGDA